MTPFLGAVFGGDVSSSRATYGGALTGYRGLFGAELEFGYTPTLSKDAGDRVKLTTVTGNLLVGLPFGAFHPYAVGGLGLMRRQASVSVPGLLNDITSNDFGVSLGGGAWIMLSPHVGLRGDLRYFHIRKSGGFSFGRGYGGVVLAF